MSSIINYSDSCIFFDLFFKYTKPCNSNAVKDLGNCLLSSFSNNIKPTKKERKIFKIIDESNTFKPLKNINYQNFKITISYPTVYLYKSLNKPTTDTNISLNDKITIYLQNKNKIIKDYKIALENQIKHFLDFYDGIVDVKYNKYNNLGCEGIICYH